FLFEIPFNKNTNSFFEFIIDTGANYDSSKRKSHYAIEYIENIVEWMYYKVDSNHGVEAMLNNFWNFWNTLYDKINSGIYLFSKEFLFMVIIGNQKQRIGLYYNMITKLIFI